MRWQSRTLWFSILIVVIGLLGVGLRTLTQTNQIFSGDANPLVRFGRLFVSNDKDLIGEDQGLVNVLLLGMGGQGHDGPLLTDTIVVAQISTDTREAVLLSIPRDFVVLLPTGGFRKINAAYAFAELATVGSGGAAAIETAEALTGLTIPYFAAVDFAGFTQAVDHIGGLTVTVDRAFTDATYPDERYGYLTPITFTAGEDHMNGTRALQFARSRHGTNGEGSDFARSERQKKIITAFAQKIIRLKLTDLKTLTNLLRDFTEHFRTNLEPHELKRLAELAGAITSEQVYSFALSPDGTLVCEGVVEDYTVRAYIIQPCPGQTYQDVNEYIVSLLLAGKLAAEGAILEIQNSTGQPAAAQQLGQLTQLIPQVQTATFRSRLPYERTILYDNSHGQFPQTAHYLKNNFGFAVADVPYTNSSADFVIILGKDAL